MPKTVFTSPSLEGRAFADEAEELAALKAQDWYEALKAFVPAAVSAGQLFTHSNRLVDARNTLTLTAEYAQSGDTPAHLLGREKLTDMRGSAEDSPKFKLLLATYQLGGRETSLADAILSGRPAGLALADKAAPPASERLDTLDKVVLMPTRDVSGYVALLPKTPAFLYPALLDAAKTVAHEEIAEAVQALADNPPAKSDLPRFLGVQFRARATKLSKAQNFSYWLNRIAGQILQPIFLPPQASRPPEKRRRFIAKRWTEEGGLPVALLGKELRQAIELSGVISAIAHQRHRHGLAPGEAVDNHAVREAYRFLGTVTAMQLKALVRELPVDGAFAEERDRLLAATETDAPAWLGDLENRLFDLVPDTYRLDDDRRHFRTGFWAAAGEDEHARISASTRSRPPRVSRPHEGAYLVLDLRVSDADVGSNNISLGLPAMTAIHGFLHKELERGEGLSVRRFCPSFTRAVLNDSLVRGATSRLALWDKEIKQAVADPASLSPGQLSLGMAPHALNGRSAVNAQVSNHSKAISQPFNNDVKGSLSLSLVVELAGALGASEAEQLVVSLERRLQGARLAGGPVTRGRARVCQEPPNLPGFALARVEDVNADNPLEAVFRSVAFRDRTYLGSRPIGAIHTGYEVLAPAGEVARQGEAWPAHHVESLYSLFSFVRANHPDRQWFRLRESSSDNRCFTLC